MSQYYNVDAIKDVKKVGNVTMYLVKWEGLPESANSWEPEKNLKRCEKLVRDFKMKQISEKRDEANEKRWNRAKNRERTRLNLAHAEVCLHCAQSDAYEQARCQRNEYIQSLHRDLNRIWARAPAQVVGTANNTSRVIKKYHAVHTTPSGELFFIVSGEDGKKFRLTAERLDEINRQHLQHRGAQ
ncbi:unnamed protein product [Caenorhabditis brenneri]